MNPYLYAVFPNEVTQPFDLDSQIASQGFFKKGTYVIFLTEKS